MGSYRNVSVTLFLKQYIFLKGVFVEFLSPVIIKKEPVNFLKKSVETSQYFSLFSSFIFNVMTRLYNFYIALIFLLISKHNDVVQSDQQNWSYSISQLVYFIFDQSSPPSEVMYFCESCWMMISISLCIVSDIHFPLLSVNEFNLLCWNRNKFYQ